MSASPVRRRWTWAVAIILIATSAGVGVAARPDRAIRTATAVVAHDLCSAVFVSGADPARFYAENVRPRLGPGGSLAAALTWSVDRGRGVVDASAPFGSLAARAVVRPGYGCVLDHGQVPVAPVAPVVPAPASAICRRSPATTWWPPAVRC